MLPNRLVQQLGIQYPILQAPIGSMAGVELAAAVSNAGGLGSLALTWTPPDEARQIIEVLRRQTRHPFFVNFVLAFPPTCLEAALDAGAPIVTFSWGQPGQLIEKAHKSQSLVGVQVGTLEGAQLALDAGADFLICQGIEAGGHVQSTIPLASVLAQVLRVSGKVPIVAAGGLADGADIAWALSAGADAIMLGTRFLATIESRAHRLYKQALINAGREDTTLTVCFSGGWPNAQHRVLRNSTLQTWEAAGCPPEGMRPGEGERLAASPSGKIVTRYDDTPAAADMEGQISGCVQYAGCGVDKISAIPTVNDLILQLWSEYLVARHQGQNERHP